MSARRPIAARIADFALSFDAGTLPDGVAAAAALHFLDAVGVGLAASAGREQAGWAAASGSPGPATLLFGGTAAPGPAAMLNGALIHSLEYDDTHVASVVHGSAVAVPVALAAAEAAGADDLLTSYIVAWEVMIRIGLSAPGAFQARGAQVTSIAGAVGAAAAAGRSLGLDSRHVMSAIGIAGSQASGLLSFLGGGSSVKALNPGWAARTGIEAASLAAAGMTGPAEILEGRFGLFEVFGADPAGLEAAFADLGDAWHLPDAAFKLYPCCHYIHPFLEAMGRLREEGLTAETLDSLIVEGPAEEAPLIAEPWDRRQSPLSGYDAKWGLPYCLSLALLRGRVEVADFERDPDPDAVALARKMSWRPMRDSGFPARFPARLAARTTAGAEVRAEVETVEGTRERPISPERVLAKFRVNAARRLDAAAVAHLEHAILTDRSARGIAAALRPAPPAP